MFIKDSSETVRITTTKLKHYDLEDPEESKKMAKKPPTATKQSQIQQQQRTVTFIIPFATPGSGKSFCWDAIRAHFDSQQDWSFQSVSSDEVRGELI